MTSERSPGAAAKIALAAATALLGAAAAPTGASAQPVQQAMSATYLCEGGKVLQMVFVNQGEWSSAVVAWNGELVALRNVPTGSGVFYADFDEQRGFRWRGKGDEGFFAHLAPDDSATEQVLVGGCKAVAAR